jgi:hypothetical protein
MGVLRLNGFSPHQLEMRAKNVHMIWPGHTSLSAKLSINTPEMGARELLDLL